MSTYNLGILHPGEMGISIAASAKNSGFSVYWASAGRSAATQQRSAQQGLLDAQSVEKLCSTCQAIMSVCPPHAAEEVAREVIGYGFKGFYLDANAISPQRTIRMADRMAEAGITFIDGGIIGGPAWKPGTTWLHLSGAQAAEAAKWFAAGPLMTNLVGEEIGKASALKMVYAAYSKGTTALLAAILATADELGVRADLYQQWGHEDASFAEQTNQRVQRVTAKAWRFTGEMEEIAATFQLAGLPGAFHLAAAEIYQRMAHFKDAPKTPELEEVLGALRE